MSHFARLVRGGLAILAAAFITSCGGGGGSGAAPTATPSWTIYTPPVSAGPGVIATQVVDVTVDASIVINSSGSLLNGTTVTIPAGTLGTSGTDTVAVGYNASPTNPLDPAAVTAGATVVSAEILLLHTSTTPFASVVQVTVPYNATMLSQTDVPIVVYWEPSFNSYEAIQVVSYNQSAGTITFNSMHFSTYLVLYFKNFQLKNPISTPINFQPNQNGFSVENFSTQIGYGTKGVCYGLNAFAAWYFKKAKNAANLLPLFVNYFNTDSLFASGTAEQNVARLLIAQDYYDTYTSNSKITLLPTAMFSKSYCPIDLLDQVTAVSLWEYLSLSHSPQLITAYQQRSYDSSVVLNELKHSLLIYGWDPINSNFLIYNPNNPGVVDTLYFDQPSGKFSKFYTDPVNGVQYMMFTHDSYSKYYDPATLEKELNWAQSGWSGVPFPSGIGQISITSSVPAQPPAIQGSALYLTDSSGNIIINSSISGEVLNPLNYSHVLVYLNGEYSPNYSKIIAVNSLNGSFTLPLSGIGSNIPLNPQGNVELAMIIAGDPGVGPQAGISNGYAGFLRVTLWPEIIAIANPTVQTLIVGTQMASFSPFSSVTGGTAPYTYSITSGNLPAGLTLDAIGGKVTGTPTAAYSAANVVFSVADKNGTVASTTSTVPFTVTAGQALVATFDTVGPGIVNYSASSTCANYYGNKLTSVTEEGPGFLPSPARFMVINGIWQSFSLTYTSLLVYPTVATLISWYPLNSTDMGQGTATLSQNGLYTNTLTFSGSDYVTSYTATETLNLTSGNYTYVVTINENFEDGCSSLTGPGQTGPITYSTLSVLITYNGSTTYGINLQPVL